MKFFEVTFPGFLLGGVAVVMAETADEAVAAVRAEWDGAFSDKFGEYAVVEVTPRNGIVYFWDGDY